MTTFFTLKNIKYLACASFVCLLSACNQPLKSAAPADVSVTAITAEPSQKVTAVQVTHPPVILVSIDGFKPEYLQRGVTPTLNGLANKGVLAEAMHPSFPSITFPNHYTLVTGLRPDHHGIVGNSMDDVQISDQHFTLSNHAAVVNRRWWDQAEPIWVTAEKHGVHAATMFWPGSEADIHGVRPTEWLAFNGKLPPDNRVDVLLGWMDKPAAQRAGFFTLYFDDVDHAGHEFGPDTQQVTDAVAKVDRAVTRLMTGLDARHIDANIVIVSDHGMASTNEKRVIYLDKSVANNSLKLVTAGTYAGIDPHPGQEAIVSQALVKKHEHMECWNKADIPARLQYGKNPRVPAIICLADVGWLIFAAEDPRIHANGGAHGYDNMSKEMGALFIASGPAFKQNIILPAFDNVDVYPLLMKLIDVQALPSDGNLTSTAAALR
ncbi:ectonucleotide pyrophosphatase/phosphodiesterase [Undibacterium sp. SXout11W]|uniref:alkaline phosphatase family protein n=1 Tax=Undibacterium sp. SXout11W TaxID=3413050 RepID=UPI003BF1A5A0